MFRFVVLNIIHFFHGEHSCSSLLQQKYFLLLATSNLLPDTTVLERWERLWVGVSWFSHIISLSNQESKKLFCLASALKWYNSDSKQEKPRILIQSRIITKPFWDFFKDSIGTTELFYLFVESVTFNLNLGVTIPLIDFKIKSAN